MSTLSQFFSSGSSTIPIYAMIVGGGGAGGGILNQAMAAGGGGGGSVYQLFMWKAEKGIPYSVIVGAGGARVTGSPDDKTGGNGSDSLFAGYQARGGGGGGGGVNSSGRNGVSYGTGGGGSAVSSPATLQIGYGGGSATPQNAIFIDGQRVELGAYSGGSGGATSGNSTWNAGGGGGAGGPGNTPIGGNNSSHGFGGTGQSFALTGTFYGGGGGGGGTSGSGSGPVGGAGGGGNGGSIGIFGYYAGDNGLTNRGGGGGGAGSPGSWGIQNGGNGGSGIIIIAYSNIYPAPASITGTYSQPTIANYRAYEFTGSGTITF